MRDAKMREWRCGNGWLTDTESTEATESTEGHCWHEPGFVLGARGEMISPG